MDGSEFEACGVSACHLWHLGFMHSIQCAHVLDLQR